MSGITMLDTMMGPDTTIGTEPVMRARGLRRGGTLAPADELAAGAIALGSFQQVTQQADAKANILVAAHVGSTVLPATQIGQIGRPELTGPAAITFWVTSAAYLVGFVVSGYLLIQIIRPRTGPPSSVNPFVLTAIPRWYNGNGNAELTAKLWDVAEAVASIAVVKNAYLVRAVGWVAATVLLAVAWLAVVGVAG